MEDVYNLIQERNAYETIPFLPIHASNVSLSSLADALQTRCESLEKQYYLEQQQLLVEAHQIAEAALDHHVVTDNNNNNSNNESSNSNARLRMEVAQLHSALKDKIKTELHSTAAMETKQQLDLLNEEKSAQQTILTNLKMELDRSNEITTHLQSELENAKSLTRLSEKQFDGLKDAIRQLQLENEEKTTLNERLVENAVAEKEKMAEQFNSMNDMVERLQKEISMLKSYNRKSDRGWFRLPNSGNKDGKSTTTTAAATGGAVEGSNNDDSATQARKWGAFGAILPSKPLYSIKAHREDASCVVYDGTNLNLVATSSSDATVRVWDTSNGQLQATFSGGGSLPMTGVDMAGGLVTCCGADKTCRVWQYKTKRLIHQLAGHSQKITCVKLFPGQKNIVTGSADRSIRIWDISRHIYTQTMTFRHSSTATCTDVVVETQPVVTGHLDGGLCFWDVRSGGGDRVMDIAGVHEGGVSSVQWKPGGSSHQVLTCGRDSTMKIVDVRTQSVVKTFRDDALRIMSNNARCSFSPDAAGKYVACGGGDNGDIFVFDAASTDLKKRLGSAHQAGVVGLAWGRGGTNGQQIATVDKTGVLVLWA